MCGRSDGAASGHGPRGTRADPVPRTGARVLLLDARGRVLLLRGHDPATPDRSYWFTVGGGLDLR